MITAHRLPEEAFRALASGDGDPEVIRQLREVQHSKQLMLLHAVVKEVGGIHPASPQVVACLAGYKLLARVQKIDPGTVDRLIRLPHMGAWAHDCLTRLDHGLPPDFGYLASVAAGAAIRAGVPFELDVPVSDGRVIIPGLGHFHGIDRQSWVRMRSDGARLTVGTSLDTPCAALVPDDGSGGSTPCWHGSVVVQAEAEGRTWTVLLETADKCLNRYMLPMTTDLTTDELASWRRCIQSAWQVLVRHHTQASELVAEGVTTIVPLNSPGNLRSATAAAAFGAIATSWPPSPVDMAETLIHELQHLKLSSLTDMLPLIAPSAEKAYAPWREDPRPAAGLLQGVYAHLGVVRFWGAQRSVEAEPDNILRAEVTYERWRPTIELAADTLLKTAALTPAGTSFVSTLREQGCSLDAETVPVSARDIAAEVALDHWLNWQLRHTALDAAEVTGLAAAYQRGDPFADPNLPKTWIEEDTRKVDSTARTRMLNMRYLDPPRYTQLCATAMPGLSAADGLLLRGNVNAAVDAYRAAINADPRPDAWIGLALAIHRLRAMPLQEVFASRLPVLFEIHAVLANQGIERDPLDLAAWFS